MRTRVVAKGCQIEKEVAMGHSSGGGIYEDLGVRQVINARGHLTMLGGSILSPKVNQAIMEANRSYVEMEELLAASGRIVAEITGAGAGHVTAGACAALALGAAACMTGGDLEKIERLPDTTGMKNGIIIQKGLRIKYDKCVTVPGARLIEVGEESGTTPEQIEAAIGPKTAAIHYLAPGMGPGIVPLEEVIGVAKRHGIPVIVDAAAQVYPVENLRKYVAMGADLVCYGGKYFHAPNSAGILCGRKDLVEAAALQDFIGFEVKGNRAFGRPMKLDRQEIIAVVVALREWVTMDHRARFEGYDRKVSYLMNELKGIAGVKATPMPEEADFATSLHLTLDGKSLGKTAAEVAKALREGDPRIWVRQRGDTIAVWTGTLVDGDEQVIVERLKSLLAEV